MTPTKLLTIVSSQFLADYETLTRAEMVAKYATLDLIEEDFLRAKQMCLINSRSRIVKSMKMVAYAEDIYTLLYDWHNCFSLILPLKRSYDEFLSFCGKNKISHLHWLNRSLPTPNRSGTAELAFEYTYHQVASDRWQRSSATGQYVWSDDSFLLPDVQALIEEAALTPYGVYQELAGYFGYVVPPVQEGMDPYFKQLFERASTGVAGVS